MASDQIQPLHTIGPIKEEAGGEGPVDLAKSDYQQGRKLLASGEYAQAALCFHNALKGFEEQGNDPGVANAADRLGDTCMAREEFALAIEHYRRASAICEKEDDSFSQLSLNKKMVQAYRKLGEQEKSLELLYDMLEHYRMVQNPKGAVEILELIAEVYLERGAQGKAADAYRAVANIHARFKHQRLAEQYRLRAAALEQQGQ